MKKILLTLLTLTGATLAMNAQDSSPANFNVEYPFVNLSVTPGYNATFDVIAADESVLTALKANGQTVNDWRVNEENRFFYVWENTFTDGEQGEYAYPVGYNSYVFEDPDATYTSLNVAGAGWSGAGFNMGTGSNVNTMHWTDNTRLHIAYRTNNQVPSVAFIVGDETPGKFAIGNDFVDGASTYKTVGDVFDTSWQAIDISFADIKTVYPSFAVENKEAFTGNILSLLGGGTAGDNICIDAIYFYTPGEAFPTATAVASVNPAAGNVANTIDNVVISWPGYTVSLLNDIASKITVTLNGTPTEISDWDIALLDEDGWYVYEEGGQGCAISIGLPYFNFEYNPDVSEAKYTVKVEAGAVALFKDNTAYINAATDTYSYNVVSTGEIVADPVKGSTLESLSTFTVSFPGWTLAANPDCEDDVTVVDDTYNSYEIQGVTYNSDGSVTVTLKEPITAQGYTTVNFPDGYFKMTKGDYNFLSPSAYVMYNIEVYEIEPGLYPSLTMPFDHFTIYAKDIELVGNVEDIFVYDSSIYYPGDTPTESPEEYIIEKASSYKAVTNEDGKTGIRVNFAEPLTGTINFEIPAGTFSFNGTTYNKSILHMVVSEENIVVSSTPENNSFLKKLDKVEVYVGEDSPMSDNSWMYEVTLSYNGGEAQNISEFVSIESKTEMVDHPFYGPMEMVVSSRLVIDFGSNPYTEPGTYVIYIPGGYVDFPNMDYQSLPETILTYIVDENGSYMENLAEVTDPTFRYQDSMGTVSLSWDQKVTLKEGAFATLHYTSNDYTEEYVELSIGGFNMEEGGEPGAGPMADEEVTFDGISIEMPIDLFQKTGKYEYSIPPFIVSNLNGQMNKAQTVTFYVVEATDIKPTVTPAIELDEYGYGTANVQMVETITINWADMPIEVQEGAEFRVGENVLAENQVNVANNTLTLDVAQYFPEAGTYEVFVPDYAIVINKDALSTELVLTYITTEGSFVKFVEAEEDGLYRVYNFNGVNVLTTRNADDLRTLENGLYIVNGKKVVLRR